MPFFIRWPGGIKQPGRTFDQLVGQVDLLATFAEIVGAQAPDDAGEDSQSFAAVLRDPSAKRERLPLMMGSDPGRRPKFPQRGTIRLPDPAGSA